MSELLYEKEGGIATITLNRPDRLNAISTGMLAALSEPTVDRDTLESLRMAELGLAESASGHLTKALADLADVLTPEQRRALLERFDHGHH